MPDDEFIRSLSRCVKWEATGGKSGANFCKMADERFILKQMNQSEARSMLDFMPQYFKYMHQTAADNSPTVRGPFGGLAHSSSLLGLITPSPNSHTLAPTQLSLIQPRMQMLAKIVGVYHIGFRNTVTGRTMKQDVLVMENLFYQHQVSHIFDLKGSMRSRYATLTGNLTDVLLDQNLLEFICDNPLYIRNHSKSVLDRAIRRDTHFLSELGVMDYSLLVGFDETKQALVVGIIDYIRTFTWDKRLEMWIKSSGFYGGSGNLPTVVSPSASPQHCTAAARCCLCHFALRAPSGFGVLLGCTCAGSPHLAPSFGTCSGLQDPVHRRDEPLLPHGA